MGLCRPLMVCDLAPVRAGRPQRIHLALGDMNRGLALADQACLEKGLGRKVSGCGHSYQAESVLLQNRPMGSSLPVPERPILLEQI